MQTLNRVPPLAYIILGTALALLGLWLMLAPNTAQAQGMVPALTGPDLGIERAQALDGGRRLDAGR